MDIKQLASRGAMPRAAWFAGVLLCLLGVAAQDATASGPEPHAKPATCGGSCGSTSPGGGGESSVVNGTCGEAEGFSAAVPPSSASQCNAGNPTPATLVSQAGAAYWGWSCNGSAGGTSASCSAPFQTCDQTGGVVSPLPAVVQAVNATGSCGSLSVSVFMNFDPGILGRQGSIFVGAFVPAFATGTGLSGAAKLFDLLRPEDAASGTWLVNNGTSWSPLGTTIPAVFTGTLSNANALVDILVQANTAGLCGTEFYVGYGSSAASMLVNNTVGKAYTVMCNYGFNTANAGTDSALTLSANVQVATSDVGRNGSIYVGGVFDNQVFMYTGSAWVPFTGGTLPPYSTGVLAHYPDPVVERRKRAGAGRCTDIHRLWARPERYAQ